MTARRSGQGRSGGSAKKRTGSTRKTAAKRTPRKRKARVERRCLVVLGMHRSGTSALTRVLSLSGADLPKHEMGKSEINPRGFFESEPIYHLHEELLAQAGSAWDDLAPMPDDWLRSSAAANYVTRMAEVARDEFGSSPLFVLKDPRICRLVPFWDRVFAELDVTPNYVITVRNPLEVASSLRAAQGIDEQRAQLLWLSHFLLGERDTRKAKRAFVAYDDLLDDWRKVVKKISHSLDVAFPRSTRSAAAEIDDFLTHGLRHHEVEPARAVAREDVAQWVRETYEWALRAVTGKPSPRELDAILEGFLAAEDAFGPVLAQTEQARKRQTESAEVQARAFEQERSGFEERLQSQLQVVEQGAARAEERTAIYQHQVNELVECIKVMLAWIASTVGGSAGAAEQLDALLGALDSSDSDSIPAMAVSGLTKYRESAEVARIERVADEREHRIRELEAISNASEQQIEALGGELAQKNAALEQLEATVGQQTSELDAAHARIVELDAAHARIVELESQLDSLRATANLVPDLERHVAAQRERADKLEPLGDEVHSLRGLLAERDQQLSRLESVGAELTDLRQHLVERNAEVARLSQVHEELAGAQRELEQRGTQLDELRARLDEREREIERLTAEANRVPELREALATREAESLREQASRRDLEAKLAQVEEQIGRLETDLRSARAVERDLASARERLTDREREVSVLEIERNAQREEIARLSTELNAAYGEMQRLHGMLSSSRN